MKNKIAYGVVIGFIKLMSILPQKLRRGFFKLLATCAYLFASKTNKIIKNNLDFVYGKDSINKDELKEIQKYSYFNMVLWVQTMIENLSIKDEQIKACVTIQNEEYLTKLLKENKKVILISAHFGNMEMLSLYINKFISPVVQVARESNFKEIDNFVTKARESSGAKIVYRSGAVRHLVKAMKKSELISLIIDQNINLKDGVEVEFLGKKATQTTTSAMLARKFDAYIVPLAIFNKDDNRYNIKFYEPIKAIKSDNEEDDIKKSTQLQANALSKIINEDKKQWFWPHKRFKIFNKEIYE